MPPFLSSASSIPPSVPPVPTLPAGILSAPETAGNHQTGPGIPGPSQGLLAWPCPARHAQSLAVPQTREGKSSSSLGHTHLNHAVRRPWWLEAAVQNLCPGGPTGRRGGFGGCFISPIPIAPAAALSDHLPREIASATEVHKQGGKGLPTLLLSAHSFATHPQACLPGPRLRSGY